MQGYNCIIIIHSDGRQMLMCRRRKDPYKGLLNLVGGKIKDDENHLEAAYRETYEETGILKDDIKLTHLMTFDYPLDGCFVEVYAGKLKSEKQVYGEENPLLWISLEDDNYFDMTKYAGEGNIGHMLEILKINKSILE